MQRSEAVSSFLCRDYPCDQYSSIINLALMNTGCPRVGIQETALELLQVRMSSVDVSVTIPRTDTQNPE